jgi:DNA polymerase III gamma/tau subunit
MIDTIPEVFDIQVEDNANFFVKIADEKYGLVHNCLLKPLEEPSKDTIWVLCSMDPSKFQSGVGKALANRCSQFVLEPHSQSDMLKQASRIAKAEKMTYVMDAEKTVLKAVVRSCQEMRTLANLMESLQQYYSGMTTKPKLLSKEHIATVLNSTESSDDRLAVVVMNAVYQGQFKAVMRALLDVSDGFMFVSKLIYANSFVLNSMVLEGARHPKVWGSISGRELVAKSKGISLGTLAACNATLIEVKSLAQQFATTPEELLSAKLYRLIREIHAK